jgi:hypothetical protein
MRDARVSAVLWGGAAGRAVPVTPRALSKSSARAVSPLCNSAAVEFDHGFHSVASQVINS